MLEGNIDATFMLLDTVSLNSLEREPPSVPKSRWPDQHQYEFFHLGRGKQTSRSRNGFRVELLIQPLPCNEPTAILNRLKNCRCLPIHHLTQDVVEFRRQLDHRSRGYDPSPSPPSKCSRMSVVCFSTKSSKMHASREHDLTVLLKANDQSPHSLASPPKAIARKHLASIRPRCSSWRPGGSVGVWTAC